MSPSVDDFFSLTPNRNIGSGKSPFGSAECWLTMVIMPTICDRLRRRFEKNQKIGFIVDLEGVRSAARSKQNRHDFVPGIREDDI